jgi:uncharacterized protein (DUF1015 family)
MAKITSFRGVRYNPAKFQKMDVVISQPYDKVKGELQDEYYNLSDYNVVRVILGKTNLSDTGSDNQYTRAQRFIDEWLASGVMIREDKPAIYVYQQTFNLPSGPRTRKAYIAMFKLVDFDEGTLLPHERTLSGPKADRLNLMKATDYDTELIFALYPDPENRVNALLEKAIVGKAPYMDVREVYESDVRQQVWAVTDPEVLKAVVAEMAPKRNLIIADGHHRYETALNFRNYMREQHPDAAENSAFNYVMMSFVSMDDPGLAILPTHRLIHSFSRLSPKEVLDKAAEYFKVTPEPSRQALEADMARATAADRRIGFYDGRYHLLQLKDPAIMDQAAPDRLPAWRMLDVSILHELLIERVLEMDKESVARQENIKYLREVEEGLEAVDKGQAQFLFILNPTRMDEIKACSEGNEKMPQKSTDFYPKMISGLVMCPVGPEEKL